MLCLRRDVAASENRKTRGAEGTEGLISDAIRSVAIDQNAHALSSEDRLRAGLIVARLDRLPMSATLWRRVLLLSLGGFFEFYDLLFTGYIAPGLVASGILTPTTPGLFGYTGIAGFVAAFFSGLFLFSTARRRPERTVRPSEKLYAT